MPKGSGRKHSQNAAVMWSEAPTYHERRALGFGTQKQRFGRDSMKAFDACSLSLQPAPDPVVTPDGVLYSKEAILEALLQQKQEKQRLRKEWLSQQQHEHELTQSFALSEHRQLVSQFHSENHGGNEADALQPSNSNSNSSQSIVQVNDSHFTKHDREKVNEMKAFWLPSKTSESKPKQQKPDTEIRCPMRGTKLRRKDLVDIRWTHSPGKSHEPMCPMCKRVFTNSTTIIVIKPTGDAIDEECYKRSVKADRSFNGHPIKSMRDTIQLERPGTGFAGGGGTLMAQKYSSLGAHLSNQDQRGHPGPTSRFGLSW